MTTPTAKAGLFDLRGKVAIVTGGNGGIVQFTRSCAVAWAADNIQVNAVLPGWSDTDLTRRVDRLRRHRVFFSSHASDFVTGGAISVDGGFSVMG